MDGIPEAFVQQKHRDGLRANTVLVVEKAFNQHSLFPSMKSITQEDLMGCGIACVAVALNKSYLSTKKLFDNPEYSSARGYYCRELIKVLSKKSDRYVFSKVRAKNKRLVNLKGTIVFIERSKQYPMGHYLIKTNRGWMNSWINFPQINPAKSGFQKKLPGRAKWIIYQRLDN